jgi:hypothetical protein
MSPTLPLADLLMLCFSVSVAFISVCVDVMGAMPFIFALEGSGSRFRFFSRDDGGVFYIRTLPCQSDQTGCEYRKIITFGV